MEKILHESLYFCTSCEEVLTVLVIDIHFNDIYAANSCGRCSLPPKLKATFFSFLPRIRKIIPPSETKVVQICQQQSYKIGGFLNSGFLSLCVGNLCLRHSVSPQRDLLAKKSWWTRFQTTCCTMSSKVLCL